MPSRILRLWNPDAGGPGVGAWEEVGDSRLTAHLGAADPHPGYATDADLTAHAAAADPHSVYLTQGEADAAYQPAGSYAPTSHNHDAAYLNTSGGDTMAGPLTVSSGGVAVTGASTFSVAPTVGGSPLLTQAAGDALYPALAHDHDARYLQLAGGNVTGPVTYTMATSGVRPMEVSVTGDAGLRFYISALGSFGWGPGTGGADTTLARGFNAGELRFGASLFPTTNNLRDLGSTTARWRKLWGVDADLSGTLGVGAAAPAWPTTYRVLQVGQAATLVGGPAGATERTASLRSNSYYDGTSNKALVAGAGADLALADGALTLGTAPSVAAGAAQTLTTRLTVAQNGTVSVAPAAGAPALLGGNPNLALQAAAGGNVSVEAPANYLHPARDNGIASGHPSLRWSAVYAVNGTIQTSSRAAKEGITPLDPAAALEAVRSTPAVTFTYTAPEKPPGWYALPADPEQAQAVLEQRMRAAPLEAAARTQAGFVAEDAHALMRTGEGQTNPSNTCGVFLACLQELDRRLTALEGAS